MFYIRADANEKIGTGHVMRCLSIAEEFRKQGEQVTFIIADNRSRNMIEERGFAVICLNSIWDDLEEEISSLISVIKENNISTLLVDSYFVTELYLRKLGRYVKLIYIDDLNQFLYPVDLLINYNIYAEALNYEKRYREAGLSTGFLLGCRYVPLREEFICADKKINDTVSRILITSGGTDFYNVVGALLDGFSKRSWFWDVEYHVILGRFNENKEELKKQWRHNANIIFFDNVTNMAEHMKQCDIAITAGGVTTYELCAVGIPSVMYTLADNQLDIAKAISEVGIISWAGDVRSDMRKCINAIVNRVELLAKDVNIRKRLSKEMRTLVDGKGCQRFIELI